MDKIFRFITISEVNMSAKKIVGKDVQNQGQIQLSMHTWEPLVAIPEQGETWLIYREGTSDWLLDSRVEDGSEAIPISNLNPGDRRIEGKTVWINGIPVGYSRTFMMMGG